MEFQNWFGAISAFDCNFFASSVLFDLLLSLKNKSYFYKRSKFTNKIPVSAKQCSSVGLEWCTLIWSGFAGKDSSSCVYVDASSLTQQRDSTVTACRLKIFR